MNIKLKISFILSNYNKSISSESVNLVTVCALKDIFVLFIKL